MFFSRFFDIYFRWYFLLFSIAKTLPIFLLWTRECVFWPYRYGKRVLRMEKLIKVSQFFETKTEFFGWKWKAKVWNSFQLLGFPTTFGPVLVTWIYTFVWCPYLLFWPCNLWYFQVMVCENSILALWNSVEPYAQKLFNLIDHNSDFSQFDKVWEIIQQETTIDLKPFPSQK